MTITDRQIFAITGKDAEHFLQGLVTNDLAGLETGLVYAALLSPQGKYLADFFLSRRGEAILLDVAAGLAAPLGKRLTMYKLRAAVGIAVSDLAVVPGVRSTARGRFCRSAPSGAGMARLPRNTCRAGRCCRMGSVAGSARGA